MCKEWSFFGSGYTGIHLWVKNLYTEKSKVPTNWGEKGKLETVPQWERSVQDPSTAAQGEPSLQVFSVVARAKARKVLLSWPAKVRERLEFFVEAQTQYRWARSNREKTERLSRLPPTSFYSLVPRSRMWQVCYGKAAVLIYK